MTSRFISPYEQQRDERLLNVLRSYRDRDHCIKRKALNDGLVLVKDKTLQDAEAAGVAAARVMDGFTNIGTDRRPTWLPDIVGIAVRTQDEALLYAEGRRDEALPCAEGKDVSLKIAEGDVFVTRQINDNVTFHFGTDGALLRVDVSGVIE